jgi:peptide/nickel transport system substrate-binding protein
MFQNAADLLNKCGFKITVVTDPNALKKLATGNLTVWAAAWSAAIDPDMYQVYHKNSKATSVKNWGYDVIYRDTDKYSEEVAIINSLSNKIDAARKTINQTARKAIYAEALDLVMELAVELPTYQRNDLVVYNKDLIDVNSINQNPTHLSGVFDKLWLVDFN